eukprot:6186142-Pleurochrysis_carterae.AAC.2
MASYAPYFADKLCSWPFNQQHTYRKCCTAPIYSIYLILSYVRHLWRAYEAAGATLCEMMKFPFLLRRARSSMPNFSWRNRFRTCRAGFTANICCGKNR